MTTQAQTTDALAVVLRAVNDEKCDPAKLRELLAVRREWMEDEARAAFNAAIVQFQQRARIVARGDVANGRAYAKMDRIWREIRPLMDECGLAVTWESVKTVGDSCILDGNLRHSRGHAQPLHHEMPLPDKISGQNAAQRAGSGETYCKRYATCAALGIQTGEDTDGAPPSRAAATESVAKARKALKARGKDEAKACAYLKVTRLEDATEDQVLQLIATLAPPAQKQEPAAPADDLDMFMKRRE
jgi:hypothetical protein